MKQRRKGLFLCYLAPVGPCQSLPRWLLSEGYCPVMRRTENTHVHPGRLLGWFSCVLRLTHACLLSKTRDSIILGYCLSLFAHCCDVIVDKSNIRVEGFILAHTLRVQSVMAKKVWDNCGGRQGVRLLITLYQ